MPSYSHVVPFTWETGQESAAVGEWGGSSGTEVLGGGGSGPPCCAFPSSAPKPQGQTGCWARLRPAHAPASAHREGEVLAAY